uniref:Limkain-b1 n=1 Tax=Anthurium amnicola TaxID=1678845 RepID=A0A1D1YMP7_9ARAE
MNPRPILLHLSSRYPQLFRGHVRFLQLRDGLEFRRGRTEHFSTSSSPLLPHAPSPQWRHHEEESKWVKVAVWWDFENCNVPNGINVFRVPHRITSALRSHGIRGPVAITAFGDVSQLSRSTQDALYTAGVALHHAPSCGKNSSDRSLLADLVYWVAQNPPPVHFFLISGDRDFANILHRLRMNNYNILLACTDGASGALCSAATVMWQWNTLVRGESLTGKYFNHPPDGLYGSWYGHYRGALDNPFRATEDAPTLQPEESMESVPDAKLRQIPKALVNRLRQILYSYPEGISLTELRVELKRNNVVLDKDYFGHKKFSQLLLSMPNILRFKFYPGDAQPLVYGVRQRIMDPPDPNLKLAAGVEGSTEDHEQNREAESDGKASPLNPQSFTGNSSHTGDMSTISKRNAVDATCIGTAENGQATLHEDTNIASSHQHDYMGTLCEKIDEQPSDTQSSLMQKEAVNTEGLLGKIWKKMIGRKSESTDESIVMSETGPNLCDTARVGFPMSIEHCPNSKKMGSKEESRELKSNYSGVTNTCLPLNKHTLHDATEKLENKVNGFQDSQVSTRNSLNASESAPWETIGGTSVKHNDACGLNPGFFSRIFTWCRFWKTDSKDHGTVSQENQSSASECPRESVEGQDLHAVSGTSLNHLSSQAEPHDLFSKSHFWDSMESFLCTSKGSDLISKSRTREQLMYGLREEGPLVLSALKEGHLHQLVNLLIMDKKWLKECAAQSYPFKLAFPAKRVCIPSHAGVNSLVSIFSNRTSQSSSSVPSKQDEGSQNHQPYGNSFNGSVDAKFPKDILDLKAWFQKTRNINGCISAKDYEKHFESTFERKLDCSLYGYFTVDDLVAACTADDDSHLRDKKVSREVTLSHCRSLLMDSLKYNPQGFNIGLFRPMFFRRYAYVLDYQLLGYPKLASLLEIMPCVKIESSFILPATMFHPDSKKERGIADDVYTCSQENNKTRENHMDSKDPISDDERVWEELGPVSGIEESKQATKERVESNESAVADEEFSDPEECLTVTSESNKQANKSNNASSAFLEVLDNYYTRQGIKEGGENDKAQVSRDGDEEDQMQAAKEGMDICHAQAVDGLVDCSRKKDTKTIKSESLDLLMQKLKSRKSYSFVSERER